MLYKLSTHSHLFFVDGPYIPPEVHLDAVSTVPDSEQSHTQTWRYMHQLGLQPVQSDEVPIHQ
jgi:hypothetical protein